MKSRMSSRSNRDCLPGGNISSNEELLDSPPAELYAFAPFCRRTRWALDAEKSQLTRGTTGYLSMDAMIAAAATADGALAK